MLTILILSHYFSNQKLINKSLVEKIPFLSYVVGIKNNLLNENVPLMMVLKLFTGNI